MNLQTAARAFTAVAALWLCAGALTAGDAGADPPDVDAQEIARPADLESWPTVGTTLRMDRADPRTPHEMRQVRMQTQAYLDFVRTGAFADGAVFAATFHPVTLDASKNPQLYFAEPETALVMEIIDRSHPDGRRFYVFESGQSRAAALPAGNPCAICHQAQGGFDGTFAQFYPALAGRVGGD